MEKKQEELLKQNAQLVKQLAAKDHELRIEAALEKVRSRALAMQQPDDMLDICRGISDELEALGVNNIRNVQTAIIYEARGIYMNYEYYSLHKKTFITPVNYSHPIQADFVKNMLVEGAYMSLTLEKAELNEWFEYQKTTNQFVYPHLAEAESLNYYWFSIGPVALGISLYKPISKEGLELFKRFLDVFRLAYRRYKDVELALEQAREAKIEAALERVRSRSIGMQKSDELKEVIQVIYDQFIHLNISIEHTGFVVDYKPGGDWHFWVADKVGSPAQLTVTDYDCAWNNSFNEAKEKGIDFFAINLNFEEKNKFYRDLFANAAGEIPEHEKELIFSKPGLAISTVLLADVALYIENFAGIPYTDEENAVLMRFGKVFQQTYTRFLDLQKAEAQAREARIEAALEKVRSRSLAMHKSDELKDVVTIVAEKLQELGIQMEGAVILIPAKDNKSMMMWSAMAAHMNAPPLYVPYGHQLIAEVGSVWETDVDYLARSWSFEEKDDYWKWAFENSDFKYLPDFRKNQIMAGTGYALSTTYSKNSGITIPSHTGYILSDSEADILKRFGKVFEQAYIRFLDLQKAEAQAREGQIQLALERIRARTMAMQHSDELLETSFLLSQQFYDLGTSAKQVSIGIIDEQRGMVELSATLRGVPLPKVFDVRIDQPMMVQPTYNAWKRGERMLEIIIEGEQLREYNKLRSSESGGRYDFEDKGLEAQWIVNLVFFSQGFLACSTDIPITSETRQLLERFGGVFEQTYTRFLDLQKAEAQAREGQIQLALERVRARTMAMQRSKELAETVFILFQQFKELGESPDQATIGIINEAEWTIEYWVTMHGNQTNKVFKFSIDEPNVTRKIYDGWKAHDRSLVIELSGKELQDFSTYRAAMGGAGYNKAEKLRVINVAFFSKGLINVQSTSARSPESILLLERFAGVFEQTYTRFLDLQRAEAQTIEAQIEAGLERVRSRTMAMHNSQDVGDAMATVFDQVVKLGVDASIRTGVGIINSKTKHMEVWTAYANDDEKIGLVVGDIDMASHQMLQGVFDSWKKSESHSSYLLTGEDQKDYYRAINHSPDYQAHFKIGDLPEQQSQNAFYFPEGFIYVFSHEQLSAHAVAIFKRFAGVFGLTYRRFLDLQKAEAQVREAQIEAGLERVRSRTMAMQSSDELAETAAVVFKQLIGLGIEPNRLFIGIIKDDSGDMELWATDEDGSRVSTRFIGNKEGNRSMKKMYMGWKDSKNSIIIDMKGKELQDYFHYLKDELHVPFKLGLSQKRRVQNIAYFSQGFIGMASPDLQPSATISLLERFAGVFNLTYTRFNDLKIAEAHALQSAQDLVEIKIAREKAEAALSDLKSAQTKLIQTEKMASLGELTAGIAHEIQNPLNFVNNFSEVSIELLQELREEAEAGHTEDVMAIADDLTQNLGKINHHGKRADSIVKGMLEHSRVGTGEKQLTNINTMADEFLKLSYHGLRAKDKSFNAELIMKLDENLPKVNVAQQDIGRVLLNLFNNAFYAVNQKRKIAGADYKPTVTLTTYTPPSGGWGATVRDNGNGIPKEIIEKIYQPFFTTKPTGEGTGLGLSLSYDIVTKGHGGSITVDTKENEYTEFTITIPIQ